MYQKLDNGWVSVDDILPESNDEFLVWVRLPTQMSPVRKIARRYHHKLPSSIRRVDKSFLIIGIVLAWMYLPESPDFK